MKIHLQDTTHNLIRTLDVGVNVNGVNVGYETKSRASAAAGKTARVATLRLTRDEARLLGHRLIEEAKKKIPCTGADLLEAAGSALGVNIRNDDDVNYAVNCRKHGVNYVAKRMRERLPTEAFLRALDEGFTHYGLTRSAFWEDHVTLAEAIVDSTPFFK